MARTAARRSKSSLAIVERAYRGSLEEQYGHIVWLSQIMKAMGADTALLLKGDCVQFASQSQPHCALTIGDLQPIDLSHQAAAVAALLALRVPVYAWQPDITRLQLDPASLCDQVQSIGMQQMAALVARYDCLWYW